MHVLALLGLYRNVLLQTKTAQRKTLCVVLALPVMANLPRGLVGHMGCYKYDVQLAVAVVENSEDRADALKRLQDLFGDQVKPSRRSELLCGVFGRTRGKTGSWKKGSPWEVSVAGTHEGPQPSPESQRCREAAPDLPPAYRFAKTLTPSRSSLKTRSTSTKSRLSPPSAIMTWQRFL